MLKNKPILIFLSLLLLNSIALKTMLAQSILSIESNEVTTTNLDGFAYPQADVLFYQIDGESILNHARSNEAHPFVLRIAFDEKNDWEMVLQAATINNGKDYKLTLGNSTTLLLTENIIYKGWLKNDTAIKVQMVITDQLIQGHIFDEVGATFETVERTDLRTKNDLIALYTNPKFINEIPPSTFIINFANLIRGPYLQSGTPTSTIIKWRTNTSTDSKVWYGSSPSQLLQTATVNGSQTEHEVLIENLTPNTTYYYAIGDTDGQIVGGDTDHYFKTSPTVGTQQAITAWILGDCGTGNSNQAAVRDAYHNYIGSNHTDMILLLGDNAYNSGWDTEYQAAIFDMYTDKLKNTMMWSCPGNHDYYGQGGLNADYYDIFTFPTNGQAGGLASNTEKYYAFDYGNMHIISLDSHDESRAIGSPMLTWLENDLAATTQDWIIVIFHHPPYTKGSHNSDTEGRLVDMRQNVLPILESHGVDLVLGGHSHSYERSKLLHGHYGISTTYDANTHNVNGGDGRTDGSGAYQENVNEEGTVYIVTGSAGKISSMIGTHPAMYYSVSRLGSTILEVNGEQMDVKFLNSNGVIEDYLTILHNGIPTVNWTNPSDNTTFINLNAIPFTASATDVDGTITKVEFFVNGISIGMDSSEPYAIDWTPPSFDEYMISVVATDNDSKTNSKNLTITVQDGPNTDRIIPINASSDDAEERTSDGNMDLTSSDLELADENGTTNQEVGLRFNAVNIPRGATITNAYIQFTTDEVESGAVNLKIYGEDHINPVTFSGTNHDITCRAKTETSIDWIPAAWTPIGSAGATQQSPNLSSIIQQLVNRPNWLAQNSLAFIITGSGDRTAKSYDLSTAEAPVLHVSFIQPNGQVPLTLWTNPLDEQIINTLNPINLTATAIDDDGTITEMEFFVDNVSLGIDASSPYILNWTPPDFGNYTLKAVATDNTGNTNENIIEISIQKDRVLEVLVASGSDDAEETTSNGDISLSSSDLELADENNTTNQEVGIRFSNVNLPKSAIIKTVYIQFTTDETESNTANLNIYGEANDNPLTFTNTTNNISSRTKTSATVNWIPPAWTKIGAAGTLQQTPNLKTILEEIIARPNWLSNNAMAFIITGSGDRTAYSYNKAPLSAPKLHITYSLENVCDGDNLFINNGQIAQSSYSANQSIQSNGIVAANESTTFTAGTSITLNTGFEAKMGSNFHAAIAACTTISLLPENIAGSQRNLIADLQPISSSLPSLTLTPNPAAGYVQISYFLEQANRTTLQVFDAQGREVLLLHDGLQEVGFQAFTFGIGELEAGVYFVWLGTGVGSFGEVLVVGR